MKKMKMLLVGTMSVLLCLGILTGCDMLAPNGTLASDGADDPAEKTPLELVQEKYEKITEATAIVQEIDIVQGDVLQYESDKTFTKAGSGYRVTGSVKQLNSLTLGKKEPYTTTFIQDETVKAGAFSVRLELDELYFSAAPTYEDGVMEVSVSANGVETVFGISEALPTAARPRNMKLKIATDETHVTQMKVGYTSKNSEVSIILTFTY